MGLCVSSNVYLLYLLYLSPYSPLFTFIQQTLPLFTQGNVRGRRHRILFRNRDSQRSRLCLALPACFCVRSRSHAQSVNRNLVFHLIFVVRSQTCSESFVYYNFELCDIRSAEEAQNPFPKPARLAAKSLRGPKSTPFRSADTPACEGGRIGRPTHTHTPQVQSTNKQHLVHLDVRLSVYLLGCSSYNL